MKLAEAHFNIGKRVAIPNQGDIAIHSELRKFIYDEEGKYYITLDRITKGGRLIVRHGKETFSLSPRYVVLFENRHEA